MKFNEKSLERMKVYRIDIEEMTGKRRQTGH